MTSDAHDLPDSVPSRLGDGRYHVTGVLGSGGMGLVVAAEDRTLGRTVAIKLLADNLTHDEEARARFREEGRSAGRLRHPNIVEILDVGEERGRPYLVMERAAGGSLAGQAPLPPPQVEVIARQALAGLAHAHEAGVLHRDLKPGNLLRTSDGAIKLTDFGVARALDTPELTRTGMVVGTERYLAPERRRGAAATPGTDLYALAATLQRLLTGERHAGEASPELPADVPVRLRRLIERCLSPDPDQRPADATHAAALLDGHEPTRVLDAAPTRDGGGGGADDTTVPHVETRDPGSHASARPRARARLVLLAVLLVAIAAVAFAAAGGPGEIPRIPIEDGDPAGNARRTADWLRDLAD